MTSRRCSISSRHDKLTDESGRGDEVPGRYDINIHDDSGNASAIHGTLLFNASCLD